MTTPPGLLILLSLPCLSILLLFTAGLLLFLVTGPDPATVTPITLFPTVTGATVTIRLGFAHLHALHDVLDNEFFNVHWGQAQNSPRLKVLSSGAILFSRLPPQTTHAATAPWLINVHFLHFHSGRLNFNGTLFGTVVEDEVVDDEEDESLRCGSVSLPSTESPPLAMDGSINSVLLLEDPVFPPAADIIASSPELVATSSLNSSIKLTIGGRWWSDRVLIRLRLLLILVVLLL